MLTEIYIAALLVDEELADQVWETWDGGEADDESVGADLADRASSLTHIPVLRDIWTSCPKRAFRQVFCWHS